MSFVKEQGRLAKLTLDQLQERRLAIEADPKNRNVSGSFWIYTRRANQKLDAIAWAITYKLAEKRKQ